MKSKKLKKILEVFTKEYREETKYREFMEQNIDKFKLELSSSDCESVDERVKRLKKLNKFNVEIKGEKINYD